MSLTVLEAMNLVKCRSLRRKKKVAFHAGFLSFTFPHHACLSIESAPDATQDVPAPWKLDLWNQILQLDVCFFFLLFVIVTHGRVWFVCRTSRTEPTSFFAMMPKSKRKMNLSLLCRLKWSLYELIWPSWWSIFIYISHRSSCVVSLSHSLLPVRSMRSNDMSVLHRSKCKLFHVYVMNVTACAKSS